MQTSDTPSYASKQPDQQPGQTGSQNVSVNSPDSEQSPLPVVKSGPQSRSDSNGNGGRADHTIYPKELHLG
ncbi:hypothetical protein N7478_010230 [Penicillium angulare]|uniref:uncharacterized protein n=1 Tax=Penicillium angulare TaxID=116970 RepID=UPI0025405158|nr:uncharacterized protein N7478_010230 [Penicillium angulare]KAJ5267422.1 hypothetical protein N7478_010230 [Penicillium angulare]